MCVREHNYTMLIIINMLIQNTRAPGIYQALANYVYTEINKIAINKDHFTCDNIITSRVRERRENGVVRCHQYIPVTMRLVVTADQPYLLLMLHV